MRQPKRRRKVMGRFAPVRPRTYGASVAAALMLISGCLGGPTWIARFNYSIEMIGATAAKGDTPPVQDGATEPSSLTNGLADDVVGFDFRVESGTNWVRIRNLSPHPISVLANKAIHVTDKGTESRLWGPDHNLIPPSTIPGGSPAEFFMSPEKSNRYHSLQDTGHTLTGTRSRAAQVGRENVGRNFELELPVSAKGTVHAYRFRFTVTGFRVRLTSIA